MRETKTFDACAANSVDVTLDSGYAASTPGGWVAPFVTMIGYHNYGSVDSLSYGHEGRAV